MTVSNEDREAAMKVVNSALLAAERADAYTDLAVVSALVSHGWGPKPTVAKEDLVDHIACIEAPSVPVVNGVLLINAESMADALIPFLRECGIEVTS